MVSGKKLVIIVVSLFLVAAVAYLYLAYMKFPAILLSSKPTLSGQFIKNPDIIHSSHGWLSAIPENLAVKDQPVLNVSSNWEGNGWVGYNINSLDGRKGIATIHPIDKSVGRYIEQSTSLPAGSNYMLYLGVADVAQLASNFTGKCADVGIKAVVNDNTKNKAYTVFDKIVRNGRWYDYSIDLGSTFSGDDITLKVLGYDADGGCGSWNGEWAAVDYVDIAAK